MKNFSYWIIDQVERIHDPVHSREHIEEFVLNKFGWTADIVMKMAEPDKAEMADNLQQIYEKMLELGWESSGGNPFNAFRSNRQISTAELLAWKRNLWDGKVICAGVVKAGTGFYLDQLVLKEKNDQGSFIKNNLESLLKHVETKRVRCLSAFDPPLDKQKIWIERINVDLLFARTGRLKQDPRFLNAALKLNDLYFPYFQRKGTLPEIVHFLMALVEQELAFKELCP